MNKRCLPLLLISALTACARTAPPPSEADAQRRLTGMTASQVASCMGRPGTQQRQGSTVVWSYTAPGGAGPYASASTDPTSVEFDYSQFDAGPSSNSFNAALTPAPQAECTVNIILDHGRVGAVTFLGPNGQLIAHSDQCGAIVERCFK
jgi:hypothetical protein